MMTFYTGPDHNEIKKKFEALIDHFAGRVRKGGEAVSGASVFRFIVRLLHKELKNRKKEDKEETKS